MKRIFTLLSFILLFTIAACSSGTGSKEENASILEGNDYLVTIKTDFGTMKAVLHDLTPKHKENFVKLSKEGFYDSLLFHRVIQGFMLQGGDPTSKTAEPGAPLGFSGPGYLVDAEFRPELFHKKGAIAAARTGGPSNPDKQSSGSQFYIVQGQVFSKDQISFNQAALSKAVGLLMRQYPNDTVSNQLRNAFNEGGQPSYFQKCVELKDEITEKTGVQFMLSEAQVEAYTNEGGTPNLDGEYTVFGQVIEGLDVIDKIAAVEKGAGDRPVEDVRMYISVEEMSKAEIAQKYGYSYIQ